MRFTIPVSLILALFLLAAPVCMAGLDLYSWHIHHDNFQHFAFSDFGFAIGQYLPAYAGDIIAVFKHYNATYFLTVKSIYMAAIPSGLCLVLAIISATIRLIIAFVTRRFSNHDAAHEHYIPQQYRARNFDANTSGNLYGPSHATTKKSKKSKHPKQ